MSAEILRQAAALMRERAKAATPGPWEQVHNPTYGPQAALRTPSGSIYLSDRGSSYRGVENAEHIASWHPAVALDVADWLESAAADIWAHGPLCAFCTTGCAACDDNLWEAHARAALVVARRYLDGVQ